MSVRSSKGLVLSAAFVLSMFAQVSPSQAFRYRIPDVIALDAARDYLTASGQAADFAPYVDAQRTAVTDMLRDKLASATCLTAIRAIYTDAAESDRAELMTLATREYASRFTNEELHTLSVFFASDLGKKYRADLAAAERGSTADFAQAGPFVDGNEALGGRLEQTHAHSRIEAIIEILGGSLSAEEKAGLRAFFGSGAGARYMEEEPFATRAILGDFQPGPKVFPADSHKQGCP